MPKTTMPPSKGLPEEALLSEMVTIKKLLIYALLRDGASQKQIGAAIGVSQSSISRMFPDAAGKGSSRPGAASVSEDAAP